MKALKRISVLPEDIQLIDIDEPHIQTDEQIKVKICYAGICGFDIKNFHTHLSEKSKQKPPIVPGHEASGIVTEIGRNVKNVRVGDRIVFHTTASSCNNCEYCRSGEICLCPERKSLGSNVDGCFTEYIVIPSDNAYIIPDNVSLKTAALTEPLACCVRIVEQIGKIKRGDKVVIFGPGMIGTGCAIVAKISGADPIVVGTKHSAHRLEKISSKGIRTLVNDENVGDRIIECYSSKPDVVIDCVGDEKIFSQAVSLVKKFGKVILGASSEKMPVYPLPAVYVFRNQIQILSSQSSSPANWKRAVEIINKHSVLFDDIADSEFTLDEWKEAFSLADSRDRFKVMFRF